MAFPVELPGGTVDTIRRASVFLWLAMAVDVAYVAPSAQDLARASTPAVTLQEMEALLREGRIVARKTVKTGTTGAIRVTMTNGRLTHDAQVQSVDIYKPIFDVDQKHTEVNFRDTYRYNIAAYRLSRLLGLENVPMSIQRTIDGKPASVTWWVDDVVMDEEARMKLTPQLRMGPQPARTVGYGHIVRVFDELIQNRDRNLGNTIWTKDWTMWMIDHTRAFRTDRRLLQPATLDRCERSLFAALRGLTRPALAEAVGDSLLKDEIDAVMARRDLIVKAFESQIAQRGEGTVLYTLPSVVSSQ